MNKSDIMDKISSEAEITKAQAENALNAILEAITGTLAAGDKVTLIGFGSFSVTERAARTGRNPQTGAELKIPAGETPKFTAGKELKETVKGS